MIERLAISRFKSILDLTLDCRRVNVFIGEPDTGKTNILEALQVVSSLGCGFPVSHAVRLSQDLGFEPLFYRQFLDEPARVWLGSKDRDLVLELRLRGSDRRLVFSVKSHGGEGGGEIPFGGSVQRPEASWLRWYVYSSSENWHYQTGAPLGDDVVAPPSGSNLAYVARHNKKVYEFLREQVAALNWRLSFDQNVKRFRLSEVRSDEIINYNLDLLSDSRKRFFFYAAVLLTSRQATLVLDEPDVQAFPPYPKLLGDMIAADTQENQFFLTTHNPYFLSALAEKTPSDDLAVFVCFRGDDGATQVRRLESDGVAEIIERGASVFFNLDELLKQ